MWAGWPQKECNEHFSGVVLDLQGPLGFSIEVEHVSVLAIDPAENALDVLGVAELKQHR
jgi:hypothetical protein